MIELTPEILAALGEAMTKLEGSTGALNDSMLGTASELSGVKMDDLQKAMKKAASEGKSTADALQTVGKHADNLTDAFLSAEKGTGKYSGAVQGFGETLVKTGETLGGVAGAAVAATGALFKLAAESLKQNDVLIGAYRTLSNFGNIDSKGTEGVMEMMHNMAVTTNGDISKFTDVMKEISPTMTAFGGSVEAGSKKFSEITKGIFFGSDDLEKKFKDLGISTEDISKYASLYVNDQIRYGIAQTKNTTDLRLSFTKLMEVTTDLSELTGQTRDEQMAQLKENQRDARWRLHMLSLSPKEADMQEKMVMAAGAVSKQYGDLLKDLYASGGTVTSMQTAMTRNMIGDLRKLATEAQIRAGKAGTDPILEFLNLMRQNAPAAEKFMKQFAGGANGFTATNEALGNLNITADALNGVQTLQGMSTEKLAELQRQITEDQKKSHDKRLGLDVERERAERSSQIMADKARYAMGDLAVPALTSLAKVTNWVNEELAQFLKFISLGSLDFTNQFKAMNSLEEVEKTLKDEKERETKLLKEKNDLDEQIKENEEYISQARKDGWKDDSWRMKNLLKKQEELLAQRSQNSANLGSSQDTQSKARGAYSSMVAASPTEKGKNQLDGLTIKKGDVSTDTSKIDPGLIALAKKIQEKVPGFRYFSSFNDSMHQDRNSAHNAGKALDFTLDHWPDDKEGQALVNTLRGMGASSAIDEYNHPSKGATGGHIHAQLGAKLGGVFRGPNSGYQVELHGHEAVVPMNKFKDFYKGGQQDNTVSKSTLETNFPQATASNNNDSSRMIADIMGLMGGKFDDMISEMKRNRDVSEQLLSNARH